MTNLEITRPISTNPNSYINEEEGRTKGLVVKVKEIEKKARAKATSPTTMMKAWRRQPRT